MTTVQPSKIALKLATEAKSCGLSHDIVSVVVADLADDCREARTLLRQYADLSQPDGNDWTLFVRIEQIFNRLYMNREVGASGAVRQAYNSLQPYVSARLGLAADVASWHSPQNYYPEGNPIRVRAEAELGDAVVAAELAGEAA